QHVGGERQQVRLVAGLLAPPRFQVSTGGDLGRDARVVEREQRLVVDGDVVPAGAALVFDDLVQRGLVGGQEGQAGDELSLDQRVPDEQLTSDHRVDAV